jgi:hypothetical protein
MRLKSAHRIGKQRVVVVEYVTVLDARFHSANDDLEHAILAARQLVLAFLFTRKANANA